MLFKANVDTSIYKDPAGEYTAEGSRRFLEDTEKEYRMLDMHKDEDIRSYGIISDRINRLLQTNDRTQYLNLTAIIESEVYSRLSGIFYEFELFRLSCTIYKYEHENGVYPSIYDIISCIDDYAYIRSCVLYMLRRIQMKCPYEDYDQLFSELMSLRISCFCMIVMFRELIVGDKNYVGECLSALYEDHGFSREAELFRGFVKKSYGTGTGSPIIEENSEEQTGKLTEEPHKFCFITCYNNEYMYNECLYYINRLIIPSGCSVDTIAVSDAGSMTSGYNAAMDASDADINIYVHQDVCLINPFFLYELITIFSSEPDIGMVGVVGSPKLPPDGVMWHEVRIGSLYGVSDDSMNSLSFTIPSPENNHELHLVEAVDGLLIATNRRIRWREDIFDGWDFYDVSQAAEYRNQGLKVVVPEQPSPWAIHDDGIMNLFNYDKYRRLFLKNYSYDTLGGA